MNALNFYSVSNSSGVRTTQNKPVSVKLQPNPASIDIELLIEDNIEGACSVIVTNILGIEQPVSITKLENTRFIIEVQQLPAGTYSASLYVNGAFRTAKPFIVQPTK